MAICNCIANFFCGNYNLLKICEVKTLSEERLQKLISRAGLMSRREAENFITAGRVTVDGKIVNTIIGEDPAFYSILDDLFGN